MEVKARVVENVFGQWFACYTSESLGPFDTKEKAEAALLNQGTVANEPPTAAATPCHRCKDYELILDVNFCPFCGFEFVRE